MKKRRKLFLGLLGLIMVASFFKVIRVSEAKISWFFSGKQQKTAENEEEFIEAVYQGMLNREEEITILYYGKDYKNIHNEFLDRIIQMVFEKDNKDTNDDFDYMNYNLDEVGIHTRADFFRFVTITVTPKWKESKEETNFVNKKVNEIIESLNLNNDSDYIKIKKIHDYMIQNFEYDETLENYTAYKALKEGKTICQGYMLLTYKLLTQAGIEAKCVDGMGTTVYGTQSHGWNLVKLGKYWYNLDTTWDDPVLVSQDDFQIPEELPISYNYFLKGTKTFSKDHERSSKFTTSDFLEKYPVSIEDYEKGSEEIYSKTPIKDSKKVTEEKEKKEADSTEGKYNFSNNLWISAIIFGGLILTVFIAKKSRKN